MKSQDVMILLLLGLLIWIVGTVYYGYQGPAILETSSLRHGIAFAMSQLLSAALCIAILRWRRIRGR